MSTGAQETWLTVREIRERFALKGEVSDASTGRIQQAADAACGHIDKILSRRFIESTYRRMFDTAGETFIALPTVLIVDVLAVEIARAPAVIGTADDAARNPNVVFFDEQRIHRLARFPSDRLSTLVEWVAGYQPFLIPTDVRSAAQTIAMILTKEERRAGEEGASRGDAGSAKFLRKLDGIERTALETEIASTALLWNEGYPLPGDEGGQLGVFQLGASELGPP